MAFCDRFGRHRTLGVVEIRAGADVAGNITSLVVRVEGRSVVVPSKWLETLPAVPLSSMEIRSEPGRAKEPPWLYVLFRRGIREAKGTLDIHLAVQGGKLEDAMITKHDGKGGSTTEWRKPQGAL